MECQRTGADLFEDDSYLAYDERLVQAIEVVAESTHQKRAWKDLLYMRYDAKSAFGEWVANHPEAFSLAETLIGSPDGPRRSNGIYLTAAILTKNENGAFTPATYRHIRELARTHILRDIPPVRYDAIQALVLIGKPSDALFLDKYAADCSDPAMKDVARKGAQTIRSSFVAKRS